MKGQILDKALVIFNEKGYIGSGVREIARTLGISPGNLSYHFAKKEDILIALLEKLSQQNNLIYEEYFNSPPTNTGFLVLMQKIFRSQYQFRGVYIGNQFVQAELQQQDRFDYRDIKQKREAALKEILEGLVTARELKMNHRDIQFMVSYLTLFGRFWLSEATLFEKSPDRESTINHYLSLLARQLSFFATKQGMKSIRAFKREMKHTGYPS